MDPSHSQNQGANRTPDASPNTATNAATATAQFTASEAQSAAPKTARPPIYSTPAANSSNTTNTAVSQGGPSSAYAATLRFDALLLKCEKARATGLAFDELRELGWLYRHHTAWLARERARGEDPERIRALNALCVRAYSVLYIPVAKPRDAHDSFLTRIRDALGKTWRAQVLAWCLLLTGALVGGLLVQTEPDAVYALIPEAMGYSAGNLDRLVASPEARAEFLERQEVPVSQNIFFGSWLFSNNTKVGILAFATGLLAGIPTILLQLYNGIVLGALSTVFLQDPWPVAYLAWILPHGIPELTAIVLCTAGGLLLGRAIGAPGPHGRKHALREAIDPALLLLAAAVPLFLLAALIESFVRESTLGHAPRFAIAALNFVLIFTLLYFARRYATARKVTTDWLLAPTGNSAP